MITFTSDGEGNYYYFKDLLDINIIQKGLPSNTSELDKWLLKIAINDVVVVNKPFEVYLDAKKEALRFVKNLLDSCKGETFR